MKGATIFIFPSLIAILAYQFQVCVSIDAENLSPILKEVEFKKALFYNRKPEGNKDKVNVVYLRVPEDHKEPEAKRTRRQAGSYWRAPPYSYGQPPLNPTGPPPGAFSPGSPFVYGHSPERRKVSKRKFKSKPKPTRVPIQSKTPCPYKQLAEELAAEQQRRQHEYEHVSVYPHPPPQTTTTTTTPRPTTTSPPIYSHPRVLSSSPVVTPSAPVSSQTMFYNQPIDQFGSMQQQEIIRLQQSSPFQYETIPQDLFQSRIANIPNRNSLQFPLLMENNNGLFLQQQQQNNPTIGLPQQQFIYNQDLNSGDFTGRGSSSHIIINPQQHPNIFNDPIQQFGRMTGVAGNQILFERQSQSPQHLALAPSQSAIYPNLQQQQQQLILLENPQNSQVSQPSTYILPSGQVIQVQQQQQQPQQPMILLNSPSEHMSSTGLSFMKAPAALNRRDAIRFSHSDFPILSDGGYASDPDPPPLILRGGVRHRNRLKSPGRLPLFLRQPAEDEEEEDIPSPVLLHQRKKEKRTRDKEKKRYILIPKKELEQIKNKKLAWSVAQQQELSMKKNLPPPPEVVHIPSYPTPEDDEEDAGDVDNDNSDDAYNFNSPLNFSGSQHKQQEKINLEENLTQKTDENHVSIEKSMKTVVSNEEDMTEE